MHYFWLSAFCALLVYRLCFPECKGYDCVIFSAFSALLLSIMGTKEFVQCAGFLFCMAAANVVISIRKSIKSSGAKRDDFCILLCEAGDGVFAVLHGGKVEIGITYADRKYRRGDVVLINAYNENDAVSVEFV